MKTPNQHAAAASEKLAFTIAEAAQALTLGRSSLYRAIRAKKIDRAQIWQPHSHHAH
jgi:hypothetical protein